MKKRDCLECKYCFIEDIWREAGCRKENKIKWLKLTKEGFPKKTNCKSFKKAKGTNVITINEVRNKNQTILKLIKIQEEWEEELKKNPKTKYEDILKKHYRVK